MKNKPIDYEEIRASLEIAISRVVIGEWDRLGFTREFSLGPLMRSIVVLMSRAATRVLYQSIKKINS